MKTFPVIAVLLLIFFHQIKAQVIDDFFDGNFTANPSWFGSTSDFIINASSQLQLNAVVAGKSWLSTPFQITPNQKTVWELYVKQSFAPSGANFGRFYLMSDQLDLSGPLNGYFLQLGEAGSGDAVELFRQTGEALAPLCRASPGRIASAFAIRIRVIRENNGDWQILIAYDATDNFAVEATGFDDLHQVSEFTGVLCNYTITNATRFYFDDFNFVTTDVGDTSPPKVVSVEVVTPQELRTTFSEEMDPATVSNPLMYAVTELSMNPVTVKSETDSRTVLLLFSDNFRNGHRHTLKISGVTDIAGNALVDTAVSFLFFQPHPVKTKDVIFTELLPDPSPAVGLPETEYIELYNRSSHPVDLSGWTISDERASARLPNFIFLPGTHLLLTNASEKFHPLENVLDVLLPSLNNSGDLIKIQDPDGIKVDSVAYSEKWYGHDTVDGGWALELIDPQNICAGARNWAVSESSSGGTPGKENSVNASLVDNMGPILLSAIPYDSVTLNVAFNEALDRTVPPVNQFKIEPTKDIVSVRFSDATLTSITLILGTPIQPGVHYTLTIRDLYDCSGNRLQDGVSSTQFIIPEKAEQGDIVINEILFNPMPQGVDFVEVFNRSGKVIDLNRWSLVNEGNPENQVRLFESSALISPGEYRVFTEDVNVLKGEYIAGEEGSFRETDLPALNDDQGVVVLRDDLAQTMDSIFYSEDYHSPFVKDGEGISLERISVLVPGTESSNWTSASATSGFATPGYLNSNARSDGFSDETITIEPEIIQPESFALIKYQFDQGGVVANVSVLDHQGRSIRHIASNELLGTHGFFRWNSDRDDGSAAGVGYYVVRFEIFDAEGMVQVIRKRLAVFR